MVKKTVQKNSSRKPSRGKRLTAQQVRQNELRELEGIKQEIYHLIYNNNPISRTAIAGRLGSHFGGERDLYATFGYPYTLTYYHYRTMYDRMGMSTRIVEKFSDDTWGKHPVLVDGDARSDKVGDKTTDFLDDWNALVKRLKVWQIMRQADIMCGLGRFSLIFMGTTGEFKSAIRRGSNLFYLNAFDENQATIRKFITANNNEMYGMPEIYDVQFDDLSSLAGGSTQSRAVHYTRVIHVAENKLGSRVFGRPRMQEVFNRLMDLEKVTGGGAEAAWLAVYMGFLILTREGTEMPNESSEEWRKIDEAMERFAHRIQRYATLEGVDKIENLGVHEVRVADIWKVLIADLAGSKNIPQRILIGSERGELASGQDMQEWNGVIHNRQTNFAEPEMLDPFVSWCVANEVIRPPKSGSWSTEWPKVYTPTQIEEADYALRVAQGANQATNGTPEMILDPNEWRGMLHLPPMKIAEMMKRLGEMDNLNGGVNEKDEEAVLRGEKAKSGDNPDLRADGTKTSKVTGPYAPRAGTPNLNEKEK